MREGRRILPKSAPRVSAGLLLYRKKNRQLEVFLAHPGGPFFKNKDEGHWTIPKGEVEPGEELMDVARREFREEIGIDIEGHLQPLGSIQQKGGKIVHAWAVSCDRDIPEVRSNCFLLEWPPMSGRFSEFPEVDRAEFFPISMAARKIKETQRPLLERLEQFLAQQIPGA